MSVRVYADEHVPAAVIGALRRAGYEVVRAVDVFPQGTPDRTHFAKAVTERRTILSQDTDFLVISADHLASGGHHGGIIYWAQEAYSIGEVIRRLLRYLELSTEESRRDLVKFL